MRAAFTGTSELAWRQREVTRREGIIAPCLLSVPPLHQVLGGK